jgi:hypothetical protein
VETSQSALFLDSSQGSDFPLLFLYSRGHIRNAMIASEFQAMTDVSEMAQKLMSTCESAMAIICCADTGSDEHDTANARRVRSTKPPPDWRN